MAKAKTPTKRSRIELPLLPTADVIPLPGLVIPVYITKEGSLNAVNEALRNESELLLCPQDDPNTKRGSTDSFRRIAGVARIVQTVRMSNGDLKVSFHVVARARIVSFSSMSPYVKATVELITPERITVLTKADETRIAEVKQRVLVLAQYEQGVEEHVLTLQEMFDPGTLADAIGSLLPLETREALLVLEELNAGARLKMVASLLAAHIDTLAIKERVSVGAQRELGREQHQELLREQLRIIQAELGEGSDHEAEIGGLKSQVEGLKCPPAVKLEAQKQLRRLQQLHPDTSEAALVRTYLDWIVELPWAKRTKDKLDLKDARAILDQDHCGLEKSKQRILDFLGVRKLKKGARGPILLFVGPPGVGKTSLGRSIARALGRKFVRVSVGGLRDEAELRGHRRTYVGALPGRIIQGLKSCGTKNPVFMLDELDKVGSDFRGDPASVLLEILDPEQNKEFEDHYLNVPFDLSEVMFIGTANITDTIPAPLLDRMEIIELSGYTTEEKLQIAKDYLIPRELDENGLGGRTVALADETIRDIIHGYTRESGVRDLGRVIGTVFRKLARVVAEGGSLPKRVSSKAVEDLLGPVRYIPDKMGISDEVGVVTGLAWTPVGGEVLTVEVSITRGRGQLSLTGQLGDVMRESAQAALTFVLSRADEFGFEPDFFETSNVHVHVPHGSIPKDGPSAGIAIATALVSMLTGRPVSRHVAMTGEMTLRGSVLAIGGLREKALAALRAGSSLVIIPRQNERELREFPPYLLEKVTFAPVDTVSEVIKLALLPKPVAIKRSASRVVTKPISEARSKLPRGRK